MRSSDKSRCREKLPVIMILLLALAGFCCGGGPTPLVAPNARTDPPARNEPGKDRDPDDAAPARVPVDRDDREAKAKEIDRLNLANYYRIVDGMTYEEVERILGPATEEMASNSIGSGTEFATKTVMLAWKGAWGKNAIITFQNGRVMARAQSGLPQGTQTPDYIDPAIAAKQQQEAEERAERLRRAKAQQEAEKERREAEEAAKWRTWHDADGTHAVDAQYRGMVNGSVSLKKKNGKVIKVPLDKLSDEDRKWITNWAKR